MTISDLLRHRLANQRIAPVHYGTPGEVVSHLGAIQAQDYLGALWSIGLRLPGERTFCRMPRPYALHDHDDQGNRNDGQQ